MYKITLRISADNVFKEYYSTILPVPGDKLVFVPGYSNFIVDYRVMTPNDVSTLNDITVFGHLDA